MLRRINKDIKTLNSNGYNINFENDNDAKVILVNVKGPKDTIYESGNWEIRIEFPTEYPFKSPSVSFLTKIFHPNVEFNTGSICLDAITTNWTPSYDILNVVSVFIPQLLSYPNPDDPFNIEAATIFKNNKNEFNEIVKLNINKYCK
jgi:ubiquitin-protein ligase